MPDDTTKQAAQAAAPLWAMAGGASIVGGIAQAAVTLALGMSYSTARFIGFVLLSMVISGGTTVLMTELAHARPLVAAVIGALTGTVPSLIVIRIALQKLLDRYEIKLSPESLKELGEARSPDHLPQKGGEEP